MKFLLDFLPIGLFFVIYKTKNLHFYQNEGLHSAIIAMALATVVQIGVTYLRQKKFEKVQVIGLLLLLVFGGVTIYIDNPVFIMWKVSALYVLFAAVLVGSIWIGKKTLLARMLGKELDLPDALWRALTWLWGLGFAGIAFINAYYFVLPAIAANDAFFGTGERFGLSGFDCATLSNQALCVVAQQVEESWVNFKLFGTMGLTFVLIVVTVVFISKYNKEQT
ncbi:Intracellular septation protein IspA [uncultured Candidatus Thioglobus sp.]|nr:Intracellular septation protein IspA [uncultured Candidatus Thioglobus sp.]